MAGLKLNDLFEKLEQPIVAEHSNRFSAQTIPDYPRHRIAKDGGGLPALLLAIKQGGKRMVLPTINLENLSVQYNTECMITHADGAHETAQFTVVRCISADQALLQYFLHILEGLIVGLGQEPTQSDVVIAINSLVELFRGMRLPAR